MSTFLMLAPPEPEIPASQTDNFYLPTPRAKLKGNGSLVAADLSSTEALKGYKEGPILRTALPASPESGFGAWLRDVGNIIATSQMYLRMRGGKSGLGSDFDFQKMAVPRSAILDSRSPKPWVRGQCAARTGIDGEQLLCFRQNLVEFWNASTRPVTGNGLGFTPEQAARYVDRFQALFELLPETPEIFPT